MCAETCCVRAQKFRISWEENHVAQEITTDFSSNKKPSCLISCVFLCHHMPCFFTRDSIKSTLQHTTIFLFENFILINPEFFNSIYSTWQHRRSTRKKLLIKWNQLPIPRIWCFFFCAHRKWKELKVPSGKCTWKFVNHLTRENLHSKKREKWRSDCNKHLLRRLVPLPEINVHTVLLYDLYMKVVRCSFHFSWWKKKGEANFALNRYHSRIRIFFFFFPTPNTK